MAIFDDLGLEEAQRPAHATPVRIEMLDPGREGMILIMIIVMIIVIIVIVIVILVVLLTHVQRALQCKLTRTGRARVRGGARSCIVRSWIEYPL